MEIDPSQFDPTTLPRPSGDSPEELLERASARHVGVRPDFLDRHPDLKASMRTILMDWLAQVCSEWKYNRETYLQTVSVVDHFLAASSNLPKAKLQCLGITALWVVSKIEEVDPYCAGDHVCVCNGAITLSELLDMEKAVCRALNWRLTSVTAYRCVHLHALRLEKRVNVEEVMDIVNLATLDAGYSVHAPSDMALKAISIVHPEVKVDVRGLDHMEKYREALWTSKEVCLMPEGSRKLREIFKMVK